MLAQHFVVSTGTRTILCFEVNCMHWIKKVVLILLVLSISCAGIPEINQVPGVAWRAFFFPTIAAHTDARIIAGNRVELLFNGEHIFPAMLEAIRSARKSITYAQYLYKDRPIAYELAKRLASAAGPACKLKF